MNGFPANKLAGLALILGPCLMLAAIVATPGGMIVASARAGEIIAIVQAMNDYPTLGHLSANLGIVGVVLAVWGFWYILRCQDNRSTSGVLIQWGALILILALAGLAIGRGMTNLVVHILTAPAVTQIPQEQLFTSVGTIEAVRGGFRVTSALVLFAGSLALAVGLASRFAGGIQKPLAIAAIILSAVAIVSFFAAQHGGSPAVFYRIVGVIGIPMMLWYLALGFGIYRDNPAFTNSDEEA